MGELKVVAPATGFEVGPGQIEYVDEDGVATVPIVAITLLDPEGDRYQFTMPPDTAVSLAPVLELCGQESNQAYYPKEAAKERRSRRRALIAGALVLILFCSIDGWNEANATASPGTALSGVLAGFTEMFTIIGMITVMHFAFKLKARRRLKAARVIPQPKENGDAEQSQ